jgi:RNA-directed DNA polymerase
MSFFGFIKRLVGWKPTPKGNYCPRCGRSAGWSNGRCASCAFPAAQRTDLKAAPARPAAAAPPTSSPSSPARSPVDASQFLPLSNAEAASRAKQSATLRSNPWWGRLDTIPPASDDRTNLIDRTLVAYGFFTPDQLVEIHEIGDKMLRITGERALADAEARAVLARDNAERAAIKARKKAESAERKRLRAEAVAHRRATDIIYLGRGVSDHLADRRANPEKLRALNLPLLASPADIAAALNITIPRLRWLAFHSEASGVSHYVRFNVPKKSGGVRELAAPHRDLALAQRWIFQNILTGLPTHAAAHGFVRGRSVRTNAEPHVGRHTLINADLKDFFPSITFHRVRGAFEELGYSPAAATVLALLCTESPRRTVRFAGKTYHVASGPRALPQGACTSPAISNLIARRLDARLSGIATKLGWTYTRYADDISFSAPAEAEPTRTTGYVLARIRHIAEDEGFRVNEKKTRILRRSTAMSVTGVVVNDHMSVRRRDVRRLRALLHNAKDTGLEAQNRHSVPNFEAKVRGQIEFVRMVNPELAAPLIEAFDALRR